MERKFKKQFGYLGDTQLFKVPGRLEIGGNHTDHNGGFTLSAPIGMYCCGLVSKTDTNKIRIYSDGFGMCEIDVENIENPGGFGAFAAGVVCDFQKKHYKIGGFDMYTESDIPAGAGLSSSAAFAVLVGCVLNELYNKGRIKPIELAKAAQYAEREFYGKSCGLLDQLTCAYAAPILTDFSKEKVKKIRFSLDNYDIILADTGSSHEGLDNAYGAIPKDMKKVAALLGKDDLHSVSRRMLIQKSDAVRSECGDLALLRALHFVDESARAQQQARALEEENINEFLRLVRESGRSSCEYLQNTFVPGSKNQPIMIALNIAQSVLGSEGAYRVHGGGFAGAVLIISPSHLTNNLKKQLKKVFGKNCINEVIIPA